LKPNAKWELPSFSCCLERRNDRCTIFIFRLPKQANGITEDLPASGIGSGTQVKLLPAYRILTTLEGYSKVEAEKTSFLIIS
jgi:hypothetical protein